MSFLTDSSLYLIAISELEFISKALEWPVCPTSWQSPEKINANF